MEEIFPNALAQPAYSAIITMINALPWVITPELTHTTVIARCYLTTHSASLCGRLRRVAEHTEHVLCLLSREDMIFHIIVTESASVPAFTGSALHFNVSLIVYATKIRLRFFRVSNLAFIWYVLQVKRGIGWNEIGRAKIEQYFLTCTRDIVHGCLGNFW